MRLFERYYHLLNILSIDVAIGAVCSALFFAKILHVKILPYGLISLGLTVWIIYTTDHLLDAYRIKKQAATERHQFHQRHFKNMFIVLIVAVALDAIIILFVRKPVFMAGVFVGGIVAVYLVLSRFLKFLKEIFIALLYTVGVLLPSLAVSEQPWPWLIILQFLLVALTNLIVFSWFDYERDTADGSTSFVTVIGKSFSRVFMALLFTTGVVLGIANNSIPSYILLGMDLVMLILFLRPQQFAIRDRFRIAGDSIFFIPALYLWL